MVNNLSTFRSRVYNAVVTANSPSKYMPLKHVLKREELYLVLLKYQWFLLIVGILFSLGASMIYPIHPDEKVFIHIAETMVAGGVPYRDVFDNKPPGIYLLLSPFVAIFGPNLTILRLIPFILNIVIGLLLRFICRTILGRREGVVIAFLYLIISPFYQANFIVTEVPMTACLLVGTLLAWVYRKNGMNGVYLRRQEVFWVGFWIGLAILFKQTALIYSLIMPFLLFSPPKRCLARKSVLSLSWYIAGLFTPITMTVLYLISHNILAISYRQIIEYNIQSYPSSSLSVMLNFIPHLLLPIVLLWGFMKMLVKKTKLETYYLYSISLFILISIPLLLFRPYHHYWIPLLPYLLLFL